MFILMGLGNPGPKYEQTRHNIGFALVDRLAEEIGGPGSWKAELKSLTRKLTFADQTVLAAKPQTFMNLSGEATQALLAYYKLPPQNLVVVVDDLYLDLGAVRIRSQGGHGGHNGLRNIIQHCGDDFARIRIGVGPCPQGRDMADFVLAQYGPVEKKILASLEADFPALIKTGLMEGWEKAASNFNRRNGPQG